MKKLVFSLLVIIAIGSVFTSCKKDDNTDPDNNDKNSYALVIDNGAQTTEMEQNSKGTQTLNYSASLVDKDGNVTSNYDVTWSSSDNNIIDITSSGVVTVKDFGNVTITATATVEDSTYTVSVPLGIQQPCVFAVAPSAILYEKGGELQLETAYFSLNGQSPSYTYSSDNNNIATVSASGLVSFTGVGSCIISVTANLQGNPVFYIPVVVFEVPEIQLPVTQVKLNKNSVDLLKSETDQLTAKAYNSDGEVTGKTFVWSSSNENIATIDQTGKIVPKSSGTTYVRATCDGMFDQAEVVVYPDTMVFVTPFYAEIGAGSSYQFTAKAYKTSRSIPTVEYDVDFAWELLDYGPGFEMFNIGTVSDNGLVSVKFDAMIGMATFLFAYDPNNLTSVGGSMVMVKLDF